MLLKIKAIMLDTNGVFFFLHWGYPQLREFGFFTEGGMWMLGFASRVKSVLHWNQQDFAHCLKQGQDFVNALVFSHWPAPAELHLSFSFLLLQVASSWLQSEKWLRIFLSGKCIVNVLSMDYQLQCNKLWKSRGPVIKSECLLGLGPPAL